MKPYSKDLRLRVLAAVERGVPREEVARTFSVSVPTIKRWLKRRRETGDVEPKPIPPGRPPLKGAVLEEWLPSHLLLRREPRPDAGGAPRGVGGGPGRRGVDLHTVGRAMGRAIGRLPGGWPLKKSRR